MSGEASAAVDDVIGELTILLGELADPVLLVLDDYHLIESATVRRAVALLVDGLPERAHVIIATRADPALPLARLRARAELVEIRADALRFTQQEAAEFFAERMGLALAGPDVESLVARTEGWPAALQLAGLSLAGRADRSAFVRDFAATHRFVLDFISD